MPQYIQYKKNVLEVINPYMQWKIFHTCMIFFILVCRHLKVWKKSYTFEWDIYDYFLQKLQYRTEITVQISWWNNKFARPITSDVIKYYAPLSKQNFQLNRSELGGSNSNIRAENQQQNNIMTRKNVNKAGVFVSRV